MSADKKFNIQEFMPFHDFIIVEEQEAREEVSKGGIIIAAETKEEKIKIGTVVGIGAEVPQLLNIGDEVYFSNFGGCDLPTAMGNYRQIRFTEIYGKRVNH